MHMQASHRLPRGKAEVRESNMQSYYSSVHYTTKLLTNQVRPEFGDESDIFRENSHKK